MRRSRPSPAPRARTARSRTARDAGAATRSRFADVPVLVTGFRRMVRGARVRRRRDGLHDLPHAPRSTACAFTALPVFLVRGFHHGAIQVLARAGSASPKDLTGGRVGVNRGYTVTTGVWARAASSPTSTGVDLDSRDVGPAPATSTSPSTGPPANVVPAAPGRTLEELLLAGELAAVDRRRHRPPRRRAADPRRRGRRDRAAGGARHLPDQPPRRRQGRSARRAHPDLSPRVFEAFAEAKQSYVEQLRNGLADTRQDSLLGRVLEVTATTRCPTASTEPHRAHELLEPCARPADPDPARCAGGRLRRRHPRPARLTKAPRVAADHDLHTGGRACNPSRSRPLTVRRIRRPRRDRECTAASSLIPSSSWISIRRRCRATPPARCARRRGRGAAARRTYGRSRTRTSARLSGSSLLIGRRSVVDTAPPPGKLLRAIRARRFGSPQSLQRPVVALVQPACAHDRRGQGPRSRPASDQRCSALGAAGTCARPWARCLARAAIARRRAPPPARSRSTPRQPNR